MATKQLQAPSSLHALVHTFLTVGQILLLILVWSIFFLWALLATENLLIPWLVTLTGGQGFFSEFFVSDISAYLVAFGLMMISITLFFYRMPRSHEKINVPLEFVLAILLFIAIQVILVGFVLPWTVHCLPTSTFTILEQLLNPDGIMSAQTCAHTGLGVLTTLLLLPGLFWLQGSNRPWQYVREKYSITSA
jgi:hypothetical protein